MVMLKLGWLDVGIRSWTYSTAGAAKWIRRGMLIRDLFLSARVKKDFQFYEYLIRWSGPGGGRFLLDFSSDGITERGKTIND